MTKEKAKFNPEESGKPNFFMNFRCPPTFSEGAFFKTVFISGDNMVRELQEAKQREIEAWNKKVVVDSTHFTVNTRQPKHLD
jgi:hypothetical protein